MENCLNLGQVAKREFAASHDGLAAATEFLDELCPNPKISIVVDEVASNVVRCSKATKFCLELVKQADGTRLVISDDGIAFDPTSVAEPDITADVESRQIGGLGLFMVRKMAKSLVYERIGDRNVLTVVV